jgi:hypothetical protein
VFKSGETSLHQLPEVMAGRVGLVDVDGDGFLDIYAAPEGSRRATSTTTAGSTRWSSPSTSR